MSTPAAAAVRAVAASCSASPECAYLNGGDVDARIGGVVLERQLEFEHIRVGSTSSHDDDLPDCAVQRRQRSGVRVRAFELRDVGRLCVPSRVTTTR